MLALLLELGRVLRDFAPARSVLLEQRSHVHESFDVQQELVDFAWSRGAGADHGLGIAPVGSESASSQTTANAEPSLDNAVGTARSARRIFRWRRKLDMQDTITRPFRSSVNVA
jgi:hypothetical protein